MARPALPALLLAAALSVTLGACTNSEPAPPSTADLNRLAIEDAHKYSDAEQCLSDFQWPQSTTTEADGRPDWYYRHDLLESLSSIGFVKRTLQFDHDAQGRPLADHPRYVYELTVRAAPLVRLRSEAQPDSPSPQRKVLCFGRLSYAGGVEPRMIVIPHDTFMGLLFHSSESDTYDAYRYEDGTVRSRFAYSLQTVPSRSDFPAEMAKLGGKEPADKEIKDAYDTVYGDVFRVAAVDVLVSDHGRGWAIEESEPAR